MVQPEPELPLSPELVLVAPEFGEYALVEERNGRLPPTIDQPAVLPAEASPEPPVTPEPATPVFVPPPPPEPLVEARAAPPPPVEAEEVAPVPAEPAGGWTLTVGGVVVILLVAFVVFGGGFLIAQSVFSDDSSSPSLAPASQAVSTSVEAPAVATPRPSSSAPRTTAVAPTPVPTQQAKPRPASTAAPKPRPTSTAASTPPPKPGPTPKTVRPIPGGGYVLPGGRFQVSSNGTAIVGFTLQTTCAGQLILPSIRIAPTGVFAFEGHPAGSSAATVRVRGTFSSPTEARGTTQITGNTCRDPATSFVARLS
jgi:hypothetical protein